MNRRYAILLLLGCAAAFPGRCVCLIRGTALDAESGKPLPKTRIFAKPHRDASKPAILRTTDLQGTFCFDHLELGAYEVVADRGGYLSALYGAKPGGEWGIQLGVDGHTELPPLTLQLVRSGSIAGTVADSNGEPLEGIQVELDWKAWLKGWKPDEVAYAQSDDRGVFRFPMLAPGTYYVSVEPLDYDDKPALDPHGQPIRATEARTFYNGSLTFARATPIPLIAGQDLANLLVTINHVTPRRFSGSLSHLLELIPEGKPRMVLRPDRASPVEIEIRNDGTFSVGGLLPASYWVSLLGVKSGTEMQVDLSNGDVENLVIEPENRVDVRFSARFEVQAANGELQLQAREMTTGTVEGANFITGSSYAFRLIPAGIYRLESKPSAKGLYVKSLTIDGQLKSDLVLDARKGQPGTVEAILSPKVAQIEGRLERPEGAIPSLATTVVMMNEAQSVVEVASDTATVDAGNRFKFESLAPGKYRLFAVEGFEEHLWGSLELAATLREKSTEVELHESETRQLVVPVISPEEWTAALRKVAM